MPVLFRCYGCASVLRVGRRKRGQVVQCPRCGVEVIVPEDAPVVAKSPHSPPEEKFVGPHRPQPWVTASAARVPSAENEVVASSGQEFPSPSLPKARPLPPSENTPSFASSSSEPASTSPPPISSQTSDSKSLSPPASQPEETPPREAPPQGMFWAPEALEDPRASAYLLVHRRMLVIQAGVLLAVAVAFGWGGFYLGWHRAGLPAQPQSGQVLLKGTVLYWNQGQLQPDAGAMVILWPQGVSPPERLSGRPFHPQQFPLLQDHPSLEALGRHGGGCAQVDSAGNYQVVLPGPGKYHLLIVSAQLQRSPGASLPQSVLEQLKKWFEPAAEPIGQQQFALRTLDVSGAQEVVHHCFGLPK